MLRSQLCSLCADDLFDEIYGKENVYAYGKLDLAEKWKREHAGCKAVFVGDMPHDYDSAEIIGCPCVLLTGGHSTRKDLELCSGAVVIDTADDLFGVITGLLGG